MRSALSMPRAAGAARIARPRGAGVDVHIGGVVVAALDDLELEHGGGLERGGRRRDQH